MDCPRCKGFGCGMKMNKDGKTWTFVRKCRKCRGKGQIKANGREGDA